MQITSNRQMTTHLFFRLLPIQILLAMVGAVNGIVSSLFASNYVGADAMTAIGLYAPVNQFVGAVSLMLVGGSQIICGKYMGKNQIDKTQSVFSLDIGLTTVFSAIAAGFLVLCSVTDLTRTVAHDPAIRTIFNAYLIGQAVGLIPMLLGQQLSAFLSLENQMRRTTIASLIFIGVNIVLNYLFVAQLRMGALGLALASSFGLWVFFLVQLQYYFSGKSLLRFRIQLKDMREAGEIVAVGFPGAISQGYQTLRRIIVNAIILQYIGSIGLSAFTASDSIFGIIWAIPTGILAVSRMLMSVSIGEEDRQTLADVMRIAMYRCVPLMCCISALLIACAGPMTHMYYHDPASEIFRLSIWGFRILPLCMPLSIICMHAVCYGQASGKNILVHLLSVLDGVVCVVCFSFILVPFIGLNGVFIANVLNGVVTTLVIIAYAWIKNRRMPRNMEELMVIPGNFGASPDERMDISLHTEKEVAEISKGVQAFCLQRDIDERTSYLAGLCLEEMAGNVVSHGFTKDTKKHRIDVRVVHKDDRLILRIKDDCIRFDPAVRKDIVDPEDITRNIGIRMVYKLADDISYQNMFGLNVLTITLPL